LPLTPFPAQSSDTSLSLKNSHDRQPSFVFLFHNSKGSVKKKCIVFNLLRNAQGF